MLSDIMIGQYFPGKSVLHRLDPRVKIALLFFFVVFVFAFDSAASYAALVAITIVLSKLSGVPAKIVLRSIKPLWWILLFTFFFHLFGTDGEKIADIFGFAATREGLARGVLISLRLVLLIVLSSLLTFTTSPLKLTDALESLLSPLKKIGVPAHEFAMMMTIALRFVPTLIEETDNIMKAQKARGAAFDEGGIIKRVTALVPILVPLFIASFRRADDLALAMEARCYRGGEGRTHFHALKVSRLDYCAVACVAVFGAVLTFLTAAGV